MKKVLLILRPGLQESFADKKNIILLLIIGFILDNGVRVMVDHAKQVGQPLGVFETFIMCLNHWYYLVIFLVGYVLILTTIPRLDSDQLLLIYRAGKKGMVFWRTFADHPVFFGIYFVTYGWLHGLCCKV